ncbi:MAG: RNA 2',3'-cyclic phosphodiesterase [Gammaproteobacteria bacterium]|nr:RNA 2',3'-cyclic phosphodiesterase [Gammaproteobacteria bacterium]
MTGDSREQPAGRLFFALWPDGETRRRLAELVPRGARRQGRPVPAENLHLTLVFLGRAEAAARDCVESAAADIRGFAVELHITHLGFWPRPRVVWAGVETTPPGLVGLVDDLRAAAAGCGLSTESRPYRAHVTLMRKARERPGFHVDIESFRWRADSFHLVESATLPAGARYRLLRSWPLNGGESGVST